MMSLSDTLQAGLLPVSYQIACASPGLYQNKDGEIIVVSKPPAEVFGERVVLPLVTKTTRFFHGLSLFVAPAFTSIQNVYTYLTAGVSFPTLLPVVSGCIATQSEHGQSPTLSPPKAPAISDEPLPPNHLKLAVGYSKEGMRLDGLGRHAAALEHMQKACKILERVLASSNPDLAVIYNNLGLVLSHSGRHAESLEYQQKALQIFEKVLPSDHSSLMGSYSNIGSSLSNLRQHAEALKYMQKALEINERTLPPDHPDLAASYNNVGLTMRRLGRYAEALKYIRKALEIARKMLPPGDPKLAVIEENEGLILKQLAVS
jgi:Tfp pilus assembly protein PilF